MKPLWQIGIIFGICFAGEGISKILPIPFPSSVIAMILLFILLFFKTLKADKIRGASDLLMRNMAFLFIPSGVGIMQIFDSISKHLLPLLAVCIISTVATFAATSYTVRGVIRIQERIGKRRERQQPLRERKDIK